MLYLFYGTDHDKLRAKLASFRSALHAKRPDAEFFKLEEEEVTPSGLDELAAGQGLFERKYIAQIDRVMDDERARDAVLDTLKELSVSDNVFLLVENGLDAATRKKIEKHATEVYTFESVKKKEKENPFALADALGARDKKRLWVEYMRVRRTQKKVEEIHGMVFWQVKGMLLASTCGSAEEAGMKTFPFNKAKKYSTHYSNEELRNLSSSLVRAYHEARRGNGDLGDNLEQWILRV